MLYRNSRLLSTQHSISGTISTYVSSTWPTSGAIKSDRWSTSSKVFLAALPWCTLCLPTPYRAIKWWGRTKSRSYTSVVLTNFFKCPPSRHTSKKQESTAHLLRVVSLRAIRDIYSYRFLFLFCTHIKIHPQKRVDHFAVVSQVFGVDATTLAMLLVTSVLARRKSIKGAYFIDRRGAETW